MTTESEASGELLYQVEDGVGILTMNRPQARNTITTWLSRDMHAVLNRIALSDEARVLILRGAGSDFNAGADIKWMLEHFDERPPHGELIDWYHASRLLHEMPQVTIAAIDGACAGAGLGWACGCDFRFSSDRAKFATAFLKVGASGDMGIAWSLLRMVGGPRARELLLLGEKFDSATALSIDLVTRVFPADTLHAETEKLAAQMAAANPLALKMMKANLVSAEKLGMAEFINIETSRHLHVAGTGSLQAGFQNFVKGREQAKG
jgi:2-(1,2-epoxy-1,2-dihydrophenyl)acetyl-CoA isomerase